MKRVSVLLLMFLAIGVLSLVALNQELLMSASADNLDKDTPTEVAVGRPNGFLPQLVMKLNGVGAQTEQEYVERITEWREINPDVVGYIDIPELEISYPVLQGETNKTYLRTNIYGEYDVAGCIFLDSSYPDIYSPMKLLHGHHMQDGTMFGKLADFLFYETLDGTPHVFYTDDLGTKEFQMFAVFSVSSAEESVIIEQYPKMEDMERHKASYVERSWVPVSEVPESPELLMLDTCWYGLSGKEHNLHCIIVAARV